VEHIYYIYIYIIIHNVFIVTIHICIYVHNETVTVIDTLKVEYKDVYKHTLFASYCCL